MKDIVLNRRLIWILILICSIMFISSVSASEMDGNTTVISSDSSNVDSISLSNVPDVEPVSDEEIPDVPDLVVNDTIYLDSDNIDDYFTDGILKSDYNDKTIIFNQDFENLGQLIINAQNVTIQGNGYNLKNTVFQVDASHVTLKGLNIVLDSQFASNDGAGIEILSDHVTIANANINYIVPQNVEAYGIYAMSYGNAPLKNLKITDSYINFEGHNDDVNVYNCALKIEDCIDSIIENNTIISSLPLKDIIFGANGAELASDLVLTVGIGGCNNISFVGNTLLSDVNKRPENSYPSLDCMLISNSNNSFICNNSIYMTDFVTYPGTDNYLYGLDIYNLNNLTACHNKISIITTGGKLAAGTAYPIQITGPISFVNITENDLYSFSNGPNIGIYSQNFYGATTLSITNNKINVTGLAGTHEWALVAGIESQDSSSTIVNNTIEVHSVRDVSADDNIYGISYRQSTAGNHQFDIEDNIVFSDGFYAVNLLTSVDSKVLNNLLVSYNSKVKNGGSGFKYWDINSHKGVEFYNNQIMNAFDYFALINNNVDNGDTNDYSTPKNNRGISNKIDGSKISNTDNENKYSFNPLIPGSSSDDTIYNNNQQEEEMGGDNNNYNNGNGNENSQNQGSYPSRNSNGKESNVEISLKEVSINLMDSNTRGGSSNTNSYSGKSMIVLSNNSDATPSSSGESSPASQSKSSQGSASGAAGESGSVSKKSYEISEKIDDEFISSVYFIIPVFILLLIGFKRKKSRLIN